MHILTRKNVSGIILICSFILGSESDGKMKVSAEKIPTSEAEFRAWLPGTEWCTKEDKNHQTEYSVRRFYPNGIMILQQDTKEWDEGLAIKTDRYIIRGHNKLQYGLMGWVVEMDDDFEDFEGKSKSIKCRGRLLGRVELNQPDQRTEDVLTKMTKKQKKVYDTIKNKRFEWAFAEKNRIHTQNFILNESGDIKGYDHPKEKFWKVNDKGQVVVYNIAKQVTWVFTRQKDKNGKLYFVESGGRHLLEM